MNRVDSETKPSQAERTYATVIAVLVPVFLVVITFSGYLKNGVVDAAMMKNDAMYCLAYLGSISLALWVSNSLFRRLTVALKNQLLLSVIQFGIPLFLFTTCFNWLFPSHISFAEHVGFNLFLAVIASWSWKRERGGELTSAG